MQAILNSQQLKSRIVPCRLLLRPRFRFRPQTRALLSNLKTRQALYWFGPAFVASIAYIDPGNFATNLDREARASATSFSGCCCGRIRWPSSSNTSPPSWVSRPAPHCRRTAASISRGALRFALWVAAELSALATDLAEFLGAALGFYLLFGGYFLHLGL